MTATGCLRMDMAVRVEPDGTGTVEIEVLLSETLAELAEAFSDEDTGDLCAEMLNESGISDLPAGVEVRDRSEDGWCGFEISFPFTDFDLTELSADDGMPIRLWVENQMVFFDLDVSDLIGDADEDEDMSFQQMAALAKVFDMELDEPKMLFEVTLPGTSVDHNADLVQGSTFNWELDLFGDESRTSIYASADMSQSGSSENASSSGLFLVGGLVGLAAILAFAMRIRSARKSDGDQEIDQKGPIG